MPIKAPRGRLRVLWVAVVAGLLIPWSAAAQNTTGSFERCRLLDAEAPTIVPSKAQWEVGERLIVSTTLANFDTAPFDISLFTILDKPVWATDADNQPCDPPTREIPASICTIQDTRNQSTSLKIRPNETGELPKKIGILVTGTVPPVRQTPDHSALRVRLVRDTVIFCEVVRQRFDRFEHDDDFGYLVGLQPTFFLFCSRRILGSSRCAFLQAM
ncbi:MAG: hypothetical protein HY558_06130 [Euryarchaeota archaeon]|nr:hypothetical protein [Euryarchaeota archaeon]